MPDFDNHTENLNALKKSQDDNHDQREAAREAKLFLIKRNGQWEQDVFDSNKDKPRYTMDLTTPIVDEIAGEMEKAEFAIVIDPADGEADEDTAETLNGMIRNIQNISKAKNTYDSSSRSMVTCGVDGWRIVQKFVDGDSFDQDLIIENINNFQDRVWFDNDSEEQDASDATRCWVMHSFSPEKYKEMWPDGSEESVSTDQTFNAYFQRKDVIIVGEVYFIKETERELVKMNTGAVHDAEKLDKVKDELQEQRLDDQVSEVNRKTVTKTTVFTRKFDGNGWLEDEEETVFDTIPVIPIYGNYSIFENKPIYFGAVEKVMDPARLVNYAISREVAEGALAPREKIAITEAQAKGHSSKYSTLNTDNDPLFIYNHVANVPPPYKMPAGAVNPGLKVLADDMVLMMDRSANRFDASRGDSPNNQSGAAIKSLQNKADIGNIKYFTSREIATCRTGQIIIKAIPKVYQEGRVTRILGEDGTASMVTLGQTVFDEESQKDVVLNDLSVGKYSVVCNAGAAFDSRQDDTVSSLLEAAQFAPQLMQVGGDIYANNITSPGFKDLSERLRAQLFQANAIPPSQWTDEERQQIAEQRAQAQNQPPVEDALLVAAKAEETKAQGQVLKIKVDQQDKKVKNQIAVARENREAKNDQIQQLIDVQKMQMEQQAALTKDNAAIFDVLKTNAETLKLIREAMGVESITGPHATESYINQAEILTETQDQA